MNGVPSRYRLNLTFEPVRELLCEYKDICGIPQGFGLNDRQRGDFEVWAIAEGARRGIDVFGNSEYLADIIESNRRICSFRDNII